jgi:hypothetical protein
MVIAIRFRRSRRRASFQGLAPASAGTAAAGGWPASASLTGSGSNWVRPRARTRRASLLDP